MQRKKALTLIGIFLVTLPISYITTAFLPQFGVLISDPLIRLGLYWVTAAEIAYISITILTSLFFTYITWHIIKPIQSQKNLIPITVFFAALPVSLIMSFFNPLARLAFLAMFIVKSRKKSKNATEGEK